MAKAGIITIHMINNYGALEQTYALNKYLRKNEIDAKTIDFRTYRVAESYRLFYPLRSVMDIVRNVQVLVYYPKLARRNKRFHEFLAKNVPMTDKTFYSNDEIEKSNMDFDYYVCGSDQIWNTYCQNYDDAFILKFVGNKGKRVSYAASMGADNIHPDKKGIFANELRQYKAISVRESSAVSVIHELSGKEVTHVLDPVFLLDADEWNKIASDVKLKKPYIFFYFVKGDLPGMREYVKKLGKQTGLPIVVVNCNLREMQYKNIKCYDAGPAEFVSLVKNAEYVVTNSFHASAFSIIFRKKFMVFNAVQNGSSRINSLLGLCNILDRQAVQSSDCNKMYDEIDYEDVHRRLKPMIEKSKEFLADALEYDRRY